jgi:hypothetical protein
LSPALAEEPRQAGPGPQEGASSQEHPEEAESRITDEYIPLMLKEMPARPRPILELGAPFLGSGKIGRGFEVPGGAIWQPSFILFGTLRSGASALDSGSRSSTEWANRLDLFGNLYLTGTERLVFGLRPLDRTGTGGERLFTGYSSTPLPSGGRGFREEFNLSWDTVSHLFFEGDLLELIPALDPDDRRGLDLGFSVGRQPIRFQEGLLIDDSIDAIGLTRNNLKLPGTANVRLTGLFGWGQINRTSSARDIGLRNLRADDSKLVGLFTETDLRSTTMALDVVYVDAGTLRLADAATLPAAGGVYAGVSFVQRIGRLNTAFRALASLPAGDAPSTETLFGPGDPAARGALFFVETSWTPHHGHDLVYATGFWASGKYRAAALDPTIPGPLARAGILFAGPGLGGFTAALSPAAENAVGGALGHQRFFANTRRQLVVEVGGRYSTRACGEPPCDPHSAAAAARYQVALGRRFVVVLDGFVAYDRLRGAAVEAAATSRYRLGSRLELLVKF